MSKCRRFSDDFKAKIALEALRGDQTLAPSTKLSAIIRAFTSRDQRRLPLGDDMSSGLVRSFVETPME